MGKTDSKSELRHGKTEKKKTESTVGQSVGLLTGPENQVGSKACRSAGKEVEADRQRERETDRQTERDKERDRERERERDRATERRRGRDRETQRHRDTEAKRCKGTERQRNKRGRQAKRQRGRQMKMDKQRQRHEDTQRDKTAPIPPLRTSYRRPASNIHPVLHQNVAVYARSAGFIVDCRAAVDLQLLYSRTTGILVHYTDITGINST